jgi:hypothetical protein
MLQGVFSSQFFLGLVILTAVIMKGTGVLGGSSETDRRFGGTFRLHLQGRNVSQERSRRGKLSSLRATRRFNAEDRDSTRWGGGGGWTTD